jgi:hypothetical protein
MSLQVFYEAGGGLAGFAVLGAFVVFMWRVARRLHLVHEVIVGRPQSQGVEAVPSMVERFGSVNDHLKTQDKTLSTHTAQLASLTLWQQRIDAEFRQNGGASMRDVVDNMAKDISELKAKR